MFVFSVSGNFQWFPSSWPGLVGSWRFSVTFTEVFLVPGVVFPVTGGFHCYFWFLMYGVEGS